MTYGPVICESITRPSTRTGGEFGMDNDWDTENAKFKARFRCSFGWTDPRGAYGSAGA